jgi:hypothetical protein
MSESELHIGKLKPIKFKEGLSFDESIAYLRMAGYKIPEYEVDHDTKTIYCDNVIHFNGTFYEITTTRHDYEAFTKLNHNDDGTIDFVSSFYNGGTCLDEMLGEALNEDLTSN